MTPSQTSAYSDDIAVILKPFPINTFQPFPSKNAISSKSEPLVLYYNSSTTPILPTKQSPSLLTEVIRYTQNKPPSEYFLNTSTSIRQPVPPTHSTRAGTKLNDRPIFRLPLVPFFGSALYDVSKLPYFNYDLPFHYDHEKYSIVRRMVRMYLVTCLGTFAKFFLKCLNSTTFYGKEKFRSIIEEHYRQREEELKNQVEIVKNSTSAEVAEHKKKLRGLLTVVNHNSMLDEPVLMSGLSPISWFLRPDIIRYAVCASDMCFGHFTLGEFFKTVKVMPLTRSGGLEQNAMKLIVDKLSKGYWLNVFPEGRIYVDGEIHQVRRGIGKLVYDCEPTPYIYPIYHRGLSDILPYDGIVPRIGKHVTVMFGDEIQVDDLVQKGRRGEMTQSEVYIAIAQRIEDGMKELKKRCEANIEQDRKQQ